MKAGSIALPAARVLNAAQPQFLDQAVLKRLVGTLDPSLGLRTVRTENLDREFVERAAELGHAGALDRIGLGNPENAMLVAVKGQRLAMRLQIRARRPEIIER
jgi:hypothetical protein